MHLPFCIVLLAAKLYHLKAMLFPEGVNIGDGDFKAVKLSLLWCRYLDELLRSYTALKLSIVPFLLHSILECCSMCIDVYIEEFVVVIAKIGFIQLEVHGLVWLA